MHIVISILNMRLSLSLFFFLFASLQMLSSKDINFVGYTYKNVEIVEEDQLSGIGKFYFT